MNKLEQYIAMHKRAADGNVIKPGNNPAAARPSTGVTQTAQQSPQAAPQQDKWKGRTFNLDRVYIGDSRGVIDKEYADEWWRRYYEKNPNGLKREDVERALGEAHNRAVADLQAHTKGTSTIGKIWQGIRGSQWFGLESGQDDKWYQEATNKGPSQATDPLQRATEDYYRNVLINKGKGAYEDQARRATGAMHVTGQVLKGVTGDTIGEWYNQKVTGQTTEDQIREYEQLLAEKIGPEEAHKWAMGLRATGIAGHLTGDVLWTMAGNKAAAGLLDTAAKGAKYAHTMRGLNNLRKPLPYMVKEAPNKVVWLAQHPTVLKMVSAGAKAYNKTRYLGPAGEGVKGVVDMYTNGGQNADRNTRFVQGVRAVADTATTVPLSAAGGAATIAAAPIVGTIATGSQLANITADAADAFAGYNDKYHAAAYGTLVADENLAIDKAKLENGSVDLPEGSYAYMNAIRKTLSPEDQKIFNERYGADAKSMTPQQKARFYEDYGAPYRMRFNNIRAANGMYKYLDKSADWEHMTPEQLKAKLASYTPEQRQKAVYESRRDVVRLGGDIDPSWFSGDDDNGLTQEQRRVLLTIYGTARWAGRRSLKEDGTEKGPIRNIFGKIVDYIGGGGRKGAIRELMQTDPAFQAAAIAYGQGAVWDTINGKGDGAPLDSTAKEVLNNMTYDQLKKTFAPLKAMQPAQLVQTLTDPKKLGAEGMPRNAVRMATDTVLKRMAADGNFTAEFMDQWMQQAKSGAGIPAPYKDRIVQTLQRMDADKFFAGMSDGNFKKFAQLMMSDKDNPDGILAQLPVDKRNAVMEKFKSGARHKAWEMIKKNPIENLPALASLWFKSQGWDKMSEWANDPIKFYGSLVLLLGGGLLLGSSLFGGDDDEDSDSKESTADRLNRMKKQRYQHSLDTPPEQAL